MATRENFRISFNGQEVIKHKWNSACREVERLIGEIAKQENSSYSLVDSSSVKVGFHHVKGTRSWLGDNNRLVQFIIEKV